MQVLLLATDEVAKLRPLTEHLPAPMAPIVDRPVMARALELLARSGLKQAWVSLYRLPSQIERCFGDGRRWGVHLDYLLQREALGSAGSLKWAEASLMAVPAQSGGLEAETAQQTSQTILVVPADMLLELDIAAAEAFHRQHGGLATAILAPTMNGASDQALAAVMERLGPNDGLGPSVGERICAINGGTATLDGDVQKYALTGAYIFEAQVLNLIPSHTRLDCARDLLPRLLARKSPGDRNPDVERASGLWGYVSHGYWNPLDTFAGFRDAQRIYLHSAWAARRGPAKVGPDETNIPQATPPSDEPRVRYPSLAGLQIAPGIWAGRNLAIHPSVRLAPPVYLGDNCQVGREAELGPLAILGANVIVDDEATVRESMVVGDTYVGRLVNVVGRIVNGTCTIDSLTGASTTVVDRFLLAETTPADLSAGLGRLGDIAGAGLLLALSLPLLVLTALTVLISSLATGQGPRVFTRRLRMGRPARSTPSGGTAPAIPAEAEPPSFGMLYLATHRADGRLLPVGRLLERLELDRLPALWNVLEGDMRLVGVQPATEDEVHQSVEDWQRERFAYPAGFTGLWYVQAASRVDADTIAVADAYYVATRSWRSDLRVLLQTPAAWVKRIKARGEDSSFLTTGLDQPLTPSHRPRASAEREGKPSSSLSRMPRERGEEDA